MKCGFSVKKPDSLRRSYAIHQKIKNPNGGYHQPQIKHPILDSINKNFKLGIISQTEAEMQIKELIKTLKDELGFKDKLVLKQVISEQNYKVYQAFYAEEYEGRHILRPHTVTNEFDVALRAFEPLSLISSPRTEMQEKVNALWNDKQHKRYVGRINQLLEAAGRGFALHTKKRIKGDVSYLTWEEFEQVLNAVQNEDLKNLYTFLFCTGVRLGEAFVVKLRDIKPNGTIFIKNQMTEKLIIRGTKNGKAHNTVIIENGLDRVKAWAALPHKEKEGLRTKCQHALIHASRKTFSDIERQVSPHDLRHSYVVYMLAEGIPLDKVSRLIGDSIKTTEDYYAGYVMSDNEVDVVTALLKKTKPKK